MGYIDVTSKNQQSSKRNLFVLLLLPKAHRDLEDKAAALQPSHSPFTGLQGEKPTRHTAHLRLQNGGGTAPARAAGSRNAAGKETAETEPGTKAGNKAALQLPSRTAASYRSWERFTQKPPRSLLLKTGSLKINQTAQLNSR